MTLRSLIKSPNMIFGGVVFTTFASILTWRFSHQTKLPTPDTSRKMALTARSVFITGGNRGLGLEFVKQLIKLPSPPDVVIAGCRDPQASTQLQALAKENPKVKIVKLDVGSDESIRSAYKEVETLVGNKGVTLLVNNAAIYDQSNDGTLANQSRAKMQKHFDINVSGPLMVTQTFLPLLKQAAAANVDKPLGCSRAGVIMMTSYMGSQEITYHDRAGIALHYKASKSAINMVTVALHHELKDLGIFIAALHPGWVKTDMGGSEAMFTPEESIKGCLNVISSAGEDFNGKLISFEGNILPY